MKQPLQTLGPRAWDEAQLDSAFLSLEVLEQELRLPKATAVVKKDAKAGGTLVNSRRVGRP